jgi:hypothetical protein
VPPAAQKPTAVIVDFGAKVLFHSTPLSVTVEPLCFQAAFHIWLTVPLTVIEPLHVTASLLGLVTCTVAQ